MLCLRQNINMYMYIYLHGNFFLVALSARGLPEPKREIERGYALGEEEARRCLPQQENPILVWQGKVKRPRERETFHFANHLFFFLNYVYSSK